MTEIVNLQMEEVSERLSEHGLSVKLSEKAREWLANIGYDPAFGARPLRRALQKYVESPLSVKILAGDFGSGDSVLVDVDDESDLEDQTLVFTLSEKDTDKPKSETKVSESEQVEA
jgi:ATP-dependent Clp protease ATP-binding subunit ClpA